MKSIVYDRTLPEVDSYDLVVCGGGPSGIPAALAAGRRGLKVLLVESTGQLGGVGTSAGVAGLLGGRTRDNRHPCVGGIFQEVTEELIRRGAGVDPHAIRNERFQPFGWFEGDLAVGFYFEPVPMVALLDEMMAEAKVDVLYFTSFTDVIVEGDKITHLILFNKSGLFSVKTSAVIDATGDADVAARAGCRIVKGRAEDGLMTPATLIFFVDGVDQNSLENYIHTHNSPRLQDIISRLKKENQWPFPFEIFISQQTPQRGSFMINTTRICDVDGTDGRSVSKGMQAGRAQVHRLFRLMKEHFPGFSESRIREVATSLGVRETRRIVGDYVYTVEDLLQGREFEDTIGFSGYNFDLPDPKNPSYQPMHGNERSIPKLVAPIPYGVMVPQPVTNIICPGRAISTERQVLGVLRVMAPCYAMGEAAGVAATFVVRDGISYAEVNFASLRRKLREAGAIVDWPPLDEKETLEAHIPSAL